MSREFRRVKKISMTDPDSGLFVKGEHERCFAYSSQTACDKNDFVLDFEVVAGNVHDSQSFHQLYDKLDLKNTKIVALDAGYKTPSVMRKIFRSGKLPAVPYTRPKTKDGFFRKSDYVYDEHFDCYLCPQNQILKYTTTNREGYREYKGESKICSACPYLSQCILSKNKTKVVTRHIWAKLPKFEQLTRNARKHRGSPKVKFQITLIFACMNLKKLAMKKHKSLMFFLFTKKITSLQISLKGLCLQSDVSNVVDVFFI